MSTANILTKPSVSATGTSENRMKLRLGFLPASARTEALGLWRTLEIDVSNRRLACSSVWTETWLNHFGGLVPHRFAIGMRGSDVCGIALVTEGVQQTAGPFALKTRHIGTAGEPESESVCIEYNALLADTADRAEFGLAIWKWIQEETNCDEFRLDGFDPTSINWFLTQNTRASVERKPSYYFDLNSVRADGADPISRLGTHTRGNIRRTIRNLGDAVGEWAKTPERSEELFHQMVQLHQARWNAAGLPGVYSSRRFLAFHLELIHRAVPLGMMALFGVTASSSLIGCCQIMIDCNRVLLYQCGRAPASGRVSYGLALDYLCICESLCRGYDSVDFLAGDTEHKRRLSTDRSELTWVVWRRPNLKNTAIDAMRHLKNATTALRRSAASGRIARPATSQSAQTPESEE